MQIQVLQYKRKLIQAERLISLLQSQNAALVAAQAAPVAPAAPVAAPEAHVAPVAALVAPAAPTAHLATPAEPVAAPVAPAAPVLAQVRRTSRRVTIDGSLPMDDEEDVDEVVARGGRRVTMDGGDIDPLPKLKSTDGYLTLKEEPYNWYLPAYPVYPIYSLYSNPIYPI